MGKNLYFHFYLFFPVEFFEGSVGVVSRGCPYRWSTDWSMRWSMDPVHRSGPRTGGQCFRVTLIFGEKNLTSTKMDIKHQCC